MEAITTGISANELRSLLFTLANPELPVRIRYRAVGQLWYPNFLRIIKIEDEKSVLFHDQARKRLIAVSDLSRIAQFELDRKAGCI